MFIKIPSMNKKIIIQPISSKQDVWKLISDIARKELHFSSPMLRYFRNLFSNDIICHKLAHNTLIGYSAAMNNQLAGCLLGTFPEGGVGTIIWLIVDSPFQSLGIGRKLFRKVYDVYKKLGCHKIKLTTNNEKSISFYEKCGMTVEGFHPHHWWGKDFWSLGIQIKKSQRRRK